MNIHIKVSILYIIQCIVVLVINIHTCTISSIFFVLLYLLLKSIVILVEKEIILHN
jgi:hypothetical protein